ncbi:ATP-binding protein [Hahella ganghwensis]|uniref:ATP-binding protein n=1 Tax=Hahella ganghwensis TaxID=286420 RepID=UPI0003A5CEF2|nr:ATP-binding protein [Hahella ganghwensis]
MRIRTKLFTALLISTTLVLVTILGLLQWRFDSTFKDYIYRREQQRHQVILQSLQSLYKQYGNWETLRRDPAPIFQILENPLVYRDLRPPGPPESHEHRGPPGRRLKLHVLDLRMIPVVGKKLSDPTLIPIDVDQNTVGWLAIPSRRNLFEANDLSFRESQRQSLLWATLAGILISLIVATGLAKQFVRPIQKLAAGARRLAKGDYATRLRPKGKDELAQLGHDFNLLARTLEDNEQTRRRWIADTSHELRTPLAIVKGEIEAMQDGVRPLEPGNLNSLHQEVTQLERLVNDLYQLTNTDIGALRYQMSDVDLCQELQETTNRYLSLLSERKLELILDIPPQEVTVTADSARLQQLIGNLLTNETKYVEEGGKVKLSLEVDAQYVILTLEDSGPGVPEESLPHLFDHLYRVEGSRNRKTGGSGLGLAICQRIVKAHEGDIEALQSELGGLLIRIRLPRKQP